MGHGNEQQHAQAPRAPGGRRQGDPRQPDFRPQCPVTAVRKVLQKSRERKKLETKMDRGQLGQTEGRHYFEVSTNVKRWQAWFLLSISEMGRSVGVRKVF